MWEMAAGLALGLLVLFYLRRSSRLRPSKSGTASARLPLRRFSATEAACAPASLLHGTLFAAAQAPRIPLPGCTGQRHCRCRLMPAPERRIGERRGQPDRRGDFRFGKTDRRSGNDRRRRGFDWDANRWIHS